MAYPPHKKVCEQGYERCCAEDDNHIMRCKCCKIGDPNCCPSFQKRMQGYGSTKMMGGKKTESTSIGLPPYRPNGRPTRVKVVCNGKNDDSSSSSSSSNGSDDDDSDNNNKKKTNGWDFLIVLISSLLILVVVALIARRACCFLNVGEEEQQQQLEEQKQQFIPRYTYDRGYPVADDPKTLDVQGGRRAYSPFVR